MVSIPKGLQPLDRFEFDLHNAACKYMGREHRFSLTGNGNVGLLAGQVIYELMPNGKKQAISIPPDVQADDDLIIPYDEGASPYFVIQAAKAKTVQTRKPTYKSKKKTQPEVFIPATLEEAQALMESYEGNTIHYNQSGDVQTVYEKEEKEAFLNSLPLEVRLEVMKTETMQERLLIKNPPPAQQTDSSSKNNQEQQQQPTFDLEFLNSLPEDVKLEILAQETIQKLKLGEYDASAKKSLSSATAAPKTNVSVTLDGYLNFLPPLEEETAPPRSVKQQKDNGEGEQQVLNFELGFDREFLDSLPEEIRLEMLAQETAQRMELEKFATTPPKDARTTTTIPIKERGEEAESNNVALTPNQAKWKERHAQLIRFCQLNAEKLGVKDLNLDDYVNNLMGEYSFKDLCELLKPFGVLPKPIQQDLKNGTLLGFRDEA